MSEELVKRLRQWDCGESTWGLLESAADRIETLEEENGVLFAANVRLNSRVDLDCDHYRDRIEKLEAEEIEFDRVIGNYASENALFRDRIEKLEAALRAVIVHCEVPAPPNAEALKMFARKALEGKDD